MKKIQIPLLLFQDLTSYVFDHPDPEDERFAPILAGTREKLEAMRRHEIYTRYKTSQTDSEKENARQEYLERIGVPEAYR